MANNGSTNSNSASGMYLEFAWNVSNQSIEGNYSDIYWAIIGRGGSAGYYIAAGPIYATVEGNSYSNPNRKDMYPGTVVLNGTTRIYHNNDGKKSFSVSFSGAIYNYAVNVSGSGSWDLPTIARKANITSAKDFNDEENPVIKYSNPAGNSVSSLQACISFDGSKDDIPYRNVSKTGNSYTFTLTNEEREILRKKSSNSNTLKVKFYLKTVIGGSTFHSIVEKTMSIVNANPVFTSTDISYEDTSTEIVNITQNNQHIVRNQSNLRVNISDASALKNASIVKYQISFNGSTKELNTGGIIEYGKINSSQNLSLTVKVIDSRGNSTTVNKIVTIFDWVNPVGTINAKRVNNYEDDTKLKIKVDISIVNKKNSIVSIKYRYKKANESTFTQYYDLQNDKEISVSINKLYVWDFQIVIKDKFGSTTYNFQIPKGMPIMFIDTLLQAIGINCFPTEKEGFFISGINFFDIFPVGATKLTTNDINPSEYFKGTWELIVSGKLISGVDKVFYLWTRIS